jgi:hypothetical protein
MLSVRSPDEACAGSGCGGCDWIEAAKFGDVVTVVCAAVVVVVVCEVSAVAAVAFELSALLLCVSPQAVRAQRAIAAQRMAGIYLFFNEVSSCKCFNLLYTANIEKVLLKNDVKIKWSARRKKGRKTLFPTDFAYSFLPSDIAYGLFAATHSFFSVHTQRRKKVRLRHRIQKGSLRLQ